MKIRKLVKRTGVPKVIFHFYIREGLLPEPRKSGVNAAEYNERDADQIQLIKNLRWKAIQKVFQSELEAINDLITTMDVTVRWDLNRRYAFTKNIGTLSSKLLNGTYL